MEPEPGGKGRADDGGIGSQGRRIGKRQLPPQLPAQAPTVTSTTSRRGEGARDRLPREKGRMRRGDRGEGGGDCWTGGGSGDELGFFMYQGLGCWQAGPL
jgi:hypothetical protein